MVNLSVKDNGKLAFPRSKICISHWDMDNGDNSSCFRGSFNHHDAGTRRKLRVEGGIPSHILGQSEKFWCDIGHDCGAQRELMIRNIDETYN